MNFFNLGNMESIKLEVKIQKQRKKCKCFIFGVGLFHTSPFPESSGRKCLRKTECDMQQERMKIKLSCSQRMLSLDLVVVSWRFSFIFHQARIMNSFQFWAHRYFLYMVLIILTSVDNCPCIMYSFFSRIGQHIAMKHLYYIIVF